MLKTTTKSSHDLKPDRCPSQGAIKVKVKVKVKGQDLHRLTSQTPRRLSSQRPVKVRGDFQVNARPKLGRLPSQSQS